MLKVSRDNFLFQYAVYAKKKWSDNWQEKIDSFKFRYWSPCLSKPGYSGTAIFSKKKPINVTYGISELDDTFDDEGRVITLEFNEYFLINVYTANSGEGLKRIDYRIKTWDTYFRNYVKSLSKKKPIIITGDLNVAHHEIDLHSPKTNKKSAGFTPEERESFTKLLNEVNLVDTYRNLYPEKIEYSYWTYLANSRSKNKGWRIDYFLISKNKLSYKFKFELDKLPDEIKIIQQELEEIKNEMKDSNLYLENYDRYQEITNKMEELNTKLSIKENRWYELLKMEEDLVSA